MVVSSSTSASWTSSMVRRMPVPFSSEESSRRRVFNVGVKRSSFWWSKPIDPTPPMPMRLTFFLSLGESRSRSLGIVVLTSSSTMVERPEARSVTQPRASAISSNSLIRTVLPMPLAPLSTMEREALPAEPSRAVRKLSSTTPRPTQNKGGAPNVGRNGLSMRLV